MGTKPEAARPKFGAAVTPDREADRPHPRASNSFRLGHPSRPLRNGASAACSLVSFQLTIPRGTSDAEAVSPVVGPAAGHHLSVQPPLAGVRKLLVGGPLTSIGQELAELLCDPLL